VWTISLFTPCVSLWALTNVTHAITATSSSSSDTITAVTKPLSLPGLYILITGVRYAASAVYVPLSHGCASKFARRLLSTHSLLSHTHTHTHNPPPPTHTHADRQKRTRHCGEAATKDTRGTPRACLISPPRDNSLWSGAAELKRFSFFFYK